MAERDDNPTTDSSFGSLFGGGQLPSIFGGNTPLTYEELQRRRAIALALASRQKGFPKNKGEGMTYLGESIGNALQGIGLDMAEKRYLAQQAANNKPVVAPPIALPPDPNDPTKNRVPSAPQKTSQAPAAVEPAATTTADAAVTPASMAAATGAEDAPGGAVPDTSAFATSSVSPSDFGTPAPPPEFPPTLAARFAATEGRPLTQVQPPAFAQRFAATEDRPLTQVQTPVPPVSVDPNMRAQLAGGGNAIDPSTMAQPNLSAFSRQASRPVVAPGTPLPMPRPDMQTAALPPQDASPQGGPTPAPDVPLPMGDPRTVGGVRATIAATLARRGWNPNAIGGTDMNVASESGYNPNQLTLHDQAKYPRFRGTEAEHAHGLYQEGGDNYNKYVAWMRENHPDAPLNDPRMQTEFLATNVSPGTVDAMNNSGSPGQAGVQLMTDYLRPAKQYQAARAREYLSGVGRTPDDTTALAQNAVSGGGSSPRAGGAPVQPVDPVDAALLTAQMAPQGPQQVSAEPPQGGGSDARLLEMMGGRRPGSPFFPATASLGRAGVATDAPSTGLAPMGTLDPMTGDVQARRDAITKGLMDQQRPPTAPEVPQPDPTQSGPTAPATSGADLTGASSNPPTVVDMAPAPPMGATAQAGVPLSGYPSVPQIAQPAPTQIQPRPTPPQIPDPQQDPQYTGQTPRPKEPTYMVQSPLEAEGKRDAANPYTRTDPAAQTAAQAKVEAGARQREQYNAQLKDRYDRQMNAWQEEQKTGLARELGKPERIAAQDAAALKLQNDRFDADVKRRFGGRDPAAVYAELDADKSDAQKNDNVLRQAAIAKEAIAKGIVSGTAADQELALDKIRAKMGDKAAAERASRTETYKAAVDSMLRTGVENLHGGAGKPGVGSRVTAQDIEIARGGTGNPALELSTINKLIAQNEREAREKINNYETKTETLLGGLGGNDNAR